MNRQADMLVDFQPSTIAGGTTGGIISAQQSYNTRFIDPYLSGSIIIDAYQGKAFHGMPYWMTGLHMQTCNNTSITAPNPELRSTITHQARPLWSQGQSPALQAPTGGVFTGVQDEC